MLRFWRCVAVALAVLAIAPAAVAAEGPVAWSVRPAPDERQAPRPNFSFGAQPSATRSDVVRLRNLGRAPLSLVLYAGDARTTDTGGIDLVAAGEKSRDVGAWIDLATDSATLAPGEILDVPFKVLVPDNAESGDHVGGIVTALAAPDTTAEGLRLDRRLATLVQVRVEGPLRPGLAIDAMTTRYRGTANPVGQGEIVATYTVRNVGNVRLSAQQSVEVAGPLGLASRRVFLDAMPELLPGNSLVLTARMPSVTPLLRSRLTVELRPLATVPGDDFAATVPVAAASASAWTVPWSLLVALAFLAGAPAGALWVWRTTRVKVR